MCVCVCVCVCVRARARARSMEFAKDIVTRGHDINATVFAGLKQLHLKLDPQPKHPAGDSLDNW